jgi:hypothetical protein
MHKQTLSDVGVVNGRMRYRSRCVCGWESEYVSENRVANDAYDWHREQMEAKEVHPAFPTLRISEDRVVQQRLAARWN